MPVFIRAKHRVNGWLLASLARIWGEGLTIHSPPVLLKTFFKVDINPTTLCFLARISPKWLSELRRLWPKFPDELRVGSFP